MQLTDNSGKYWLYDDIELGTLTEDLGTFKGSLDGAYNTISYEMQVDNAQGNAGLFDVIDGAKISNLKLEAQLKVSDLTGDVTMGALAGTIKDSTLVRVEAAGTVLEADNLNGNKVYAGGLAGSLEGENSFEDVKSFVQNNIESSDDAIVGAMIGKAQGELALSGLTASFNTDFESIGQNNLDNGTEVASSLEEGLKAAGDDCDGNIIYQDEQKASHQGFLLPYFVDDAQSEYDGTQQSYEYDSDYFDSINFGVTVQSSSENEERFMIDAGAYDYEFSSSYEGGRYIIKNAQTQGSQGTGTYTITPVYLGEIQIGSAQIEEGSELPSFEIANLDDFKDKFVEGESIDDLQIEFAVEEGAADNPGEYEISAQSANKNYVYTFKTGTLTVTAKAESETETPTEPETEQPETAVEPETSADPETPSGPDVSSKPAADDNDGSDQILDAGMEQALSLELNDELSPCDFCKGPDLVDFANESAKHEVQGVRLLSSASNLNLIAATADDPNADDDDRRLIIAKYNPASDDQIS